MLAKRDPLSNYPKRNRIYSIYLSFTNRAIRWLGLLHRRIGWGLDPL